MKKWTVQDRYGNTIYLTEERWRHILESRPELEPLLDKFLETIRTGRRKQDEIIPNEYRYYRQFNELLPENNHLVAIVIFRTQLDTTGRYVPNNLLLRGGPSILCQRGEHMNKLNLQRTEWTTTNGEVVRLVYDETEDILEAFFGNNEPATGVELTDHILLRLNQTTGRAVSLTLLHFSILAERTEYGPRSYPLDNLKTLPEELRELVVRVLTTSPVDEFLKLSYFQASPTKRVPFTYVEPSRLAMAA